MIDSAYHPTSVSVVGFGHFQQATAYFPPSQDIANVLIESGIFHGTQRSFINTTPSNDVTWESIEPLLASTQYACSFDQFDRALTNEEDSVMRRAAVRSGKMISKGFLKSS